MNRALRPCLLKYKVHLFIPSVCVLYIYVLVLYLTVVGSADQINVDVHSIQFVEAKEETSGALFIRCFPKYLLQLITSLGRLLSSFAHCMSLYDMVV